MASTLGEAYIAVRADTRPFTDNLKRDVEAAAKMMETRLGDGVSHSLSRGGTQGGREAAENFSNEFERSTRRRFGRSRERRPWYIAISSSLASALDDGISALPMEVKAGIVGGILLALPIASGALAGLVASALATGISGLGLLLVAQFDEVRTKTMEVWNFARDQLAQAALPFVTETLRAVDRVGMAILDWAPKIHSILNVAAGSGLLDTLTRGLLGVVDTILNTLGRVTPKLAPFTEAFAKGLEILAAALGEVIELLVATGDDGVKSMEDLIFFTAMLAVNLGRLLAILAEVWGFVHDIVAAAPYLFSFLGDYIAMSDAAAEKTTLYGDSLGDLTYQTDAAVVATKKQEQALKEAAKAMDQARDAAFKLIDTTVDYEESIDRLDETLKENGKTLDVTGDKGRENIRAFSRAFKDAQDRAEEYYQQGKLNAEQARALYQQELAQIMAIAKARGVDVTALQQLYQESLNLVNLPDPNTGWLQKILEKAGAAAAQLERANNAASKLNGNAPLPSGGTRAFSEYAAGSIINRPEVAVVGEAGPEVIIPLTRPARAAELAQQSGLAAMLGLQSQPNVYVYIGNEQIEGYMVKVVDRNNKALGTSMAFGARGL